MAWSTGFDCCVKCGGTDSECAGRGYCKRCYHAHYRKTGTPPPFPSGPAMVTDPLDIANGDVYMKDRFQFFVFDCLGGEPPLFELSEMQNNERHDNPLKHIRVTAEQLCKEFTLIEKNNFGRLFRAGKVENSAKQIRRDRGH